MTTIIKPTVGRIVWFYPSTQDTDLSRNGKEPLAAIVTNVWTDSCINLTVFDANGNCWSRTSVLLVQDGQKTPSGGYYAEWMPYQKGQAAKTEALEAKAALQPYQQRMVEEKSDLEEKLGKLTAFVCSPLFGQLTQEKQERLLDQKAGMEAYADALRNRIAAGD